MDRDTRLIWEAAGAGYWAARSNIAQDKLKGQLTSDLQSSLDPTSCPSESDIGGWVKKIFQDPEMVRRDGISAIMAAALIIVFGQGCASTNPMMSDEEYTKAWLDKQEQQYERWIEAERKNIIGQWGKGTALVGKAELVELIHKKWPYLSKDQLAAGLHDAYYLPVQEDELKGITRQMWETFREVTRVERPTPGLLSKLGLDTKASRKESEMEDWAKISKALYTCQGGDCDDIAREFARLADPLFKKYDIQGKGIDKSRDLSTPGGRIKYKKNDPNRALHQNPTSQTGGGTVATIGIVSGEVSDRYTGVQFHRPGHTLNIILISTGNPKQPVEIRFVEPAKGEIYPDDYIHRITHINW